MRNLPSKGMLSPLRRQQAMHQLMVGSQISWQLIDVV
jgi:hypothetical protein